MWFQNTVYNNWSPELANTFLSYYYFTTVFRKRIILFRFLLLILNPSPILTAFKCPKTYVLSKLTVIYGFKNM